VDEADAFLTLAEIAVALAASTGIILALAREPETWHPFDSLRIYLLLGSSLGATVLALLPTGLVLAGLEGRGVWRTCSAIFSVYLIAFLGAALRWVVSLSAEDRADFRPSLGLAFNGVNLIVLGAQLLSAFGLVSQRTASIYFFGLLWLVIWSALLFALLILLRPRPAD
jgi:hypothetical protein